MPFPIDIRHAALDALVARPPPPFAQCNHRPRIGLGLSASAKGLRRC